MTQSIGNLFIVLLDRTMANLELVHRDVRNGHLRDPEGPEILYEVTQTINSFLGVLVMPWDRIFDQTLLNGTSNREQLLKKLGFPVLQSSRPDTDLSCPSLGSMLDSMRNGAAHGGISLLGLWDFQRRFPERPVPMVANGHIAAIEIESKWNMGKGPRNWGCVLSVDEMRQFLEALHALSRTEKYVKADVWREHHDALSMARRPTAEPA